MAEIKQLRDTAKVEIKAAGTLNDAAWFSGDYDVTQTGPPAGDNDIRGILWLYAAFAAGPPADGIIGMIVYHLPEDTAGNYPEGSTSVVPQQHFFRTGLELRNASTSVYRRWASLPFPMYPDGNRFVGQNVSGQNMSANTVVELSLSKYQSV